jgi:hypothetical protein
MQDRCFGHLIQLGGRAADHLTAGQQERVEAAEAIG